MAADIKDSVFKITSRDSANRQFGTGFVIFQEKGITYLLSCAHVVRDVGGPDQVMVGDYPAKILACGSEAGLDDLAVLQVEVRLNAPPLRLETSGQTGTLFVAAGYQSFDRGKFLVRPIRGQLGDQVGLESIGFGDRINAWDLKITGAYDLKNGYSGSPVVNSTSGHVLAVVSHKQAEGRRGIAISVEALKKIWPEMPPGLLKVQRPHSPDDLNLKANQLSYALASLGAPPSHLIVPRQGLLDKAVCFVRQGISPVILIQGLPGYGKTILLCELARELSTDFQQVLALKFSGPLSIEPSYFLEKINTYLTQIGQGLETEVLKSQNNQRLLQSLLAQMSGLRLLILLDDVDDAPSELIDPLLQSLTATNQIQLIMTARSRIVSRAKARILTLPPLSDGESFSFIEHYTNLMNIRTDPKELLEALPTNIKEHPQALRMFLFNLEDIPFELLLMEGFPETDFGPGKLVKNILSSLGEKVLARLAFVMIFSDLDFVKSLKVLGLTPPKDFVNSIRLLLERSLVYRQDELYRVPFIVSESLSDLAPNIIDEEVIQVCNTLETEVRKMNFKDSSNHFDEFISVIAHIIHRLYQMQYYKWVTRLATDEFLEFVNIRGFWKEYWLILRVTFDSAKRIEEQTMLAHVGFRLARKSFQINDIDTGRKALADVERAIGAAGNTKDHAELLSHKALFTEVDGDIEKAIEELLESLRIRKLIGDIEGIAIIEKVIGNIYLQHKEYVKARQRYEAALTFLNEMKYQGKQLIEVEISLALCDLADGELKTAESRLRRAVERCHDTGYNAALPRAYYNLALVLDRQGRVDEAFEYAKSASVQAIETDISILVGTTILIWRLNNLSQNLKKE